MLSRRTSRLNPRGKLRCRRLSVAASTSFRQRPESSDETRRSRFPRLDVALGQAPATVAGAGPHPGERVAEPRLRTMEAFEPGLVDPEGRNLGGEPFQLGPHRVRVADLARRQPADQAPRFGRSSTRPLACSLRSASRIGVRLGTELLGERLLPEPRPGRKVAVRDAPAVAVASLSTSARRSSVAWAIKPILDEQPTSAGRGMTARIVAGLDTFDYKVDTSLESGFLPIPESPFPFTEGRLR